jgi:hypothetical protein
MPPVLKALVRTAWREDADARSRSPHVGPAPARRQRGPGTEARAPPMRMWLEGLGAVESVAKAPVGRRGVVHCPDYGLGSVAGDLDVDLVAGEAAVAPGEAAG